MHRPPRRFTLLDMMVLIAATAVSIAWMRHYAPRHGLPDVLINQRFGGWTTAAFFSGTVTALTRVTGYWLTPWTFALLILRMRPPRPRRRQLFRQPGMVACLSAALAIAGQCLPLAAAWALKFADDSQALGSRRALAKRWMLILNSGFEQGFIFWYPGLVVLVGWLTLCLSGRWRPEASMIDRAGRFVGVVWIGTHSLNILMHMYFLPL